MESTQTHESGIVDEILADSPELADEVDWMNVAPRDIVSLGGLRYAVTSVSLEDDGTYNIHAERGDDGYVWVKVDENGPSIAAKGLSVVRPRY
jgi:hypothetical protein